MLQYLNYLVLLINYVYHESLFQLGLHAFHILPILQIPITVVKYLHKYSTYKY